MGAEAPISVRGSFLVFRLAGQAYAIPIAAIQEIVPMAELAQVAGAPGFVAGLLDVGGELIPVVSLRRLFRLPDKQPELYTPLILLRSPGQAIGLQVDSVQVITDVADEDAVVLNEGHALNDFACAAARVDGVTTLIVSPERLLLEEERRRLAELAGMARERLAAVEAPDA